MSSNLIHGMRSEYSDLIRQAVIGKFIVLVFVGPTDEAGWSAEFEYPDIAVKTANEVLK